MSHDVPSLGQTVPVEQLQALLHRPTVPATSRPGRQATPVESLTPSISHTVQAGETLTSIARKYQANRPADMDLDAWILTIQMTNGLADPHAIKVGQVLTIPQLVSHGETLEMTASTAPTPYDPEQGLAFPPAGTDKRPSSPSATGGTAAAPTGGTPAASPSPKTPPRLPAWREEVMTQAADTLGTRYRWGGTDLEKGVDCSGLTQGIFDKVGVELPRTSAEQFKAGGQPVPRAELQPGDLIFFRNTKGRICHVGIYSGTDDAGRQLYISATTSKGVAEVAIDDWTRWNRSQKYAGARRFAAPVAP